MDGFYVDRLDGSGNEKGLISGDELEQDATPRRGYRKRHAGRRRRAGAESRPTTTRARDGARLKLIPVTGGSRRGDGPTVLDFAIGTEFSRRSR